MTFLFLFAAPFPAQAASTDPPSLFGTSASNPGNPLALCYEKGNYPLGAFLVLAQNATNFIFGISGSVALLVFIYGGFLWLISQGEQKRIQQGHDALVNAGIGLIIIFSSWILVNFVVFAFTGTEQTGSGVATIFGGLTKPWNQNAAGTDCLTYKTVTPTPPEKLKAAAPAAPPAAPPIPPVPPAPPAAPPAPPAAGDGAVGDIPETTKGQCCYSIENDPSNVSHDSKSNLSLQQCHEFLKTVTPIKKFFCPGANCGNYDDRQRGIWKADCPSVTLNP